MDKYDKMEDSQRTNKVRKRKSKVQPTGGADDEETAKKGRDSFAMKAFEVSKNDKNERKESYVDHFRVLNNVRDNASKWREYAKTRRSVQQSRGDEAVPGTQTSAMRRQLSRKATSGKGLDELKEDSAVPGGVSPAASIRDHADGTLDSTRRQMIVASNRTLLQYFAKLGSPNNVSEQIDLDFVESLFRNGAKMDCTDIYGQTIFHEVARAWHTDVAKFLIENKADPDLADHSGRTPLHVAAAVDYPEMVKYLIESGADIEAQTEGENQTPCHFAAKNDACQSLKMLLKLKCNKYAVDFKNRTPLQLAAELDRSETARLLVDAGVDSSLRDDSGQSAIVWMISKMAPIAKVALDQFHVMDRANRRQYYYLNKLEPDNTDHPDSSYAQNVLEMVTSTTQYDLVTHPAIKRLISIKWKQFGRVGAWVQVFQSFFFILLYTVLGVYPDWKVRYLYQFPVDVWRIIFWIMAIGMTLYQVIGEVIEYFKSSRRHQSWKKWRTEQIERDLKYCHPRWPEEEHFLQMELDEMDKKAPTYFKDLWNLLDWFCYILLTLCIVTHIADISYHTIDIARAHIRIMSINLIFLWLRLMKSVRAFEALGPFIVILGKMLGDCLRFLFLYLVFFLPFYCAFWMVFGGTNTRDRSLYSNMTITDPDYDTISIPGYDTPWDLIVSLFRLTLVDDYPYTEINEVDPLMGKLLIVAWLALSAILCLNLFIALLSDTFQRVYDNAYANAVMQKAQTIIGIQDNMLSKAQRRKYRAVLNSPEMSPEELYYDDDLAPVEDDLQKVTIQIKEELDDMKEYLHRKMGAEPYGDDLGGGETLIQSIAKSTMSNGKGVTSQKLENEVDVLREEIQSLHTMHQGFKERYKRDMGDVKNLLLEVLSRSSGPSGGGGTGRRDDVRSSVRQSRSRGMDDVDSPRGYVPPLVPQPESGLFEPDLDVEVLAGQLEPPSVSFPHSFGGPTDDTNA